MNSKVNMRSFIKSAVFMAALLFSATVNAQTYCTPTVTNIASYGIGMQNVTIGSINKSSTTPSSMPTYSDYSASSSTTVSPGATVNLSVLLGSSNTTQVKIYVDWNNDGSFNTTFGSECGPTEALPHTLIREPPKQALLPYLLFLRELTACG